MSESAPPRSQDRRQPGADAGTDTDTDTGIALNANADANANANANANADGNGPAVVLSLVSHTNVGKTTLARTLLQRDVGEVRDAAHVTQTVAAHPMLVTDSGARLELWDTPGFGDSLRLARRLAVSGKPLGWFLTEVWDRFSDRSFWLTQRTLRHVMAHTDVVLYLVDASQAPEESAHLDAELGVLGLIGKPVLVLLNQLGPPPSPAQEAAERQRWRERLAPHPVVRHVLALDAFARCWVQEATLLQWVDAVIAPARRPTLDGLRAAWRARQHARWTASMDRLALGLQGAAFDREALAEQRWDQRLRAVGQRLAGALGSEPGPAPSATQAAMDRLAARLDQALHDTTNALIALHGLDGEAGRTVMARLQTHFTVRAPVNESQSAVVGGAVAGALAGLKADIASGGLTLGGGLLVGGALGALGGFGVARGVNRLRGVATPTVAWTPAVLTHLLRSALLAYLAVVHFGRGRGGWVDAEHPGHWAGVVDDAIERAAPRRDALWARRDTLMSEAGTDLDPARTAQAHADWRREAAALLRHLSAGVLAALYPQAQALDDEAAAAGPAPDAGAVRSSRGP